jgi:hypothetical protein
MSSAKFNLGVASATYKLDSRAKFNLGVAQQHLN